MKTNLQAPLNFLVAIGLWLILSPAAVAQTSTSNEVPVVTIQATDPYGTWTGDPAVFTVFRTGNPSFALNVYCCISGTASNGVDYKSIGNFVFLDAGVMSNTIVINPIDLGQTDVRTVEVDLCPSPLMIPVNYVVGEPSKAVVYLTRVVSPVVWIVGPTNGETFSAPANISLVAKAFDRVGPITNVEFFAGSTDLGRGLPVVLDPPGVNGVTGPVYFFNWQNVQADSYALTAVASDNGGLSTTSAVVKIAVLPDTNQVPVVTIQATDPYGTWTGDPAVFTVFRTGNPTNALNVYCCISGTASNGVDYKAIGPFVSLAAEVMSNTIVINPVNLGQTNIRTVEVDLCPSPLMNPIAVNYMIGEPSNAVAYLTVLTHTNLPPVVRIISPPSGAVFRAPMHLPIYAFAADFDDPVATVEFFAGNQSLGFGQPVIGVLPGPLPPSPIVGPTNYWDFIWTNPPPGTNIALAAKATDQSGLSTTSAPVIISILPPLPPPTNRPAVVSIVATDPLAIEGTNCWTWPGLISPAATWSNWFASGATWRLFTNCGPNNATFTVFRFGATNDAVAVDYAIGGTASNGVDYVAIPGTVTILAGETRAAITIVPLDDGPPDLTSSVVLKLVADATGTNYLLGYPRSAAAIILDSQSPRPVTGVTPGVGFNLATAGPDGAWFHVEYSSDMLNWTPICTNQVVNGTLVFVDPDAATNPARFYRTVPEAGPPPQ